MGLVVPEVSLGVSGIRPGGWRPPVGWSWGLAVSRGISLGGGTIVISLPGVSPDCQPGQGLTVSLELAWEFSRWG